MRTRSRLDRDDEWKAWGDKGGKKEEEGVGDDDDDEYKEVAVVDDNDDNDDKEPPATNDDTYVSTSMAGSALSSSLPLSSTTMTMSLPSSMDGLQG